MTERELRNFKRRGQRAMRMTDAQKERLVEKMAALDPSDYSGLVLRNLPSLADAMIAELLAQGGSHMLVDALANLRNVVETGVTGWPVTEEGGGD